MAQEGTGEGEIGEAMVDRDRGSFETIVALVDEDSLKVAATCATCVIDRHLWLSFSYASCKRKTEPECRLRFFSADI
jgi:hypothetical protein